MRRHQRLKVAEESIIPTRSDQTDAVAVAATFLNIDSDFAARVHGQHRKGKAYSANPWAPASRYNTASLPKVQSTGYLDTIQNKAAVALPTPMSAGSPGVPRRVSQNQVYISMT